MFNELRAVLNYITEQIAEHGLVDLHQQLVQFYAQARTAPSPEVTESINEVTTSINDVQKSIQPMDWDELKLKIYKDFGAPSVLGITGHKRLLLQLAQHTNDPNGASETIKTFSDEITQIKQRADQAIASLGSLLTTKEELPEGKKQVQLVFEDMVAIDSLGNLIEQAKEWDLILKTFRHMIPEPDAEAELYGISKYSPTIFELAAGAHLIWAVLRITREALDITEKLYSIRKARVEIKVLEMDAVLKDNAIKALNEGEEKELKKLVAEKTKSYLAEIKSVMSKPQLAAAEPATNYTLKKIYNFTVQGGNVNVVDGEIEHKDKVIEQSKLVPTYKKIKELISGDGEVLKLASFEKGEEKEAKKTVKKEPKKVEMTAKEIKVGSKKKPGRPKK